MSTAVGKLSGFPPTVEIGPGNPEAEKYGRLWERPEYRAVAPGEALASVFLQVARPRRGALAIDFGCGTGRGALLLALLGGLRVTMIDFARNCLDPEIRQACDTQPHALTFLKHDLEWPVPVAGEFGFATDLLEHIPPDRVDRVLDHILKAAQHVFFSIATEPDVCGQLIGEPLHLTVRPAAWWRERFQVRDSVLHWERESPGRYECYVTAWASGQDIVKSGVLNIEEAQIRANVTHNIAQGWSPVRPYEPNEYEAMLVGGGPSLAQSEAAIRQKRAEGVKLITLNGTYNWCLERGLVPSAQVIVDARPFNARFTKPIVESCVYLLASQCNPSVFEGLPKERTYLWHASVGLIQDLLDAQYGAGEWYAIPGGSTVLLRAIPLLRMLGYSKFHLYGCDSCLGPNQVHHAYAQPENDGGVELPVRVGGSDRTFWAYPWMISQAQELIDLIRVFGEVIELAIYGDGMLAHLLETGATLDETTVGAVPHADGSVVLP